MRQFMRIVRQGRWFKYPVVDWLGDGELQGDALSDIRTQDCRLSVYGVSDEVDRQRVAVALAATREEISHMDYAVFSDSSLDSLGITVQATEGDTPDKTVNRMHYELGNLTVKRLAWLAEIVSAGKHERIWQRQVKALLQEAAGAGRLDKTKVRYQKMRESLPWMV